jgi:hypothetical protein
MSATKNTTFRNGQAGYFGEQFDGGEIRLLAANDDVLAVVELAATAFGSPSNGVISAAGTPLSFTGTELAGSGTNIASATLISSDETQSITGLSVGNSDAHVVIDNTNIAEDQQGNLNSFTITVPEEIADP